jgi:hypothetical protein
MGIFSDSGEEDIEAISHIIRVSLSFYAHERTKRSGAVEFEVDSNDRFEFLSEAGGRILHNLGLDSALVRVATLVVLCNVAPPFSVTKQGKPCLDMAARKEFLSRFTCLLVQAALSTMNVERAGNWYTLSWKGFPDESFAEEFLTYLQWIESIKAEPGKTDKERKQAEAAFLNILAHISLGCAMALRSCVKEDPAETDPQLRA